MHGESMPDGRFVLEAVAKTLGFPLRQLPTRSEGDSWQRMLDDAQFAAATFQFVAALKRSLDVVLITEHIDESLLLLGRRAGWSTQDLLYISQKRRKQKSRSTAGAGGAGGAAAAATDPSPAARAAGSGLLHTATDWPAAAALRAPAAPWLWPHELDSVVRANRLDALLRPCVPRLRPCVYPSCNPACLGCNPACLVAATTFSVQVRANWLDTLLHAHFNRTLWRHVAAEWPGEKGGAALRTELARFRTLRAGVLRRCGACEEAGVGPCLARARAAPAAEVTPHLCWMLSQDTRSWTEHFFQRAALRFDARAASRAAACGLRADAPGDGQAGVTTGNVRWWRCPATRRVSPSCSRIPPGRGQSHKYSAWHCMCSWRETLPSG